MRRASETARPAGRRGRRARLRGGIAASGVMPCAGLSHPPRARWQIDRRPTTRLPAAGSLPPVRCDPARNARPARLHGRITTSRPGGPPRRGRTPGPWTRTRAGGSASVAGRLRPAEVAARGPRNSHPAPGGCVRRRLRRSRVWSRLDPGGCGRIQEVAAGDGSRRDSRSVRSAPRTLYPESVARGAWCLVRGSWCLVLGAWCLVPGAWCLGSWFPEIPV